MKLGREALETAKAHVAAMIRDDDGKVHAAPVAQLFDFLVREARFREGDGIDEDIAAADAARALLQLYVRDSCEVRRSTWLLLAQGIAQGLLRVRRDQDAPPGVTRWTLVPVVKFLHPVTVWDRASFIVSNAIDDFERVRDIRDASRLRQADMLQ